jgi:hypothetical protein
MSKAQGELDSARELVTEGIAHEQEAVPNTVSDDTGGLDPRFTLWRSFCDEHAIPVETLPGDLDATLAKQWEKLKEAEIHAPTEGRT